MSKFLQAPLNRIMRNPNVVASKTNLIYDRSDIFTNNIKLLSDPITNRKLILVGTLNSSTLLAERTKKILELADPDQVLVETDEKWFNTLNSVAPSHLKTNKLVQSAGNMFQYDLGDFNNNPRNLVFKSKFYTWLFLSKMIFPFIDEETNAYRPGLEVFNTAKWAQDHKKSVLYSGRMFNSHVVEALKNESRMYLFPYIYRSLNGRNTSIWDKEYASYADECAVYGMEHYSEIIDEKKLSWLIKLFESIIPHQKKIFIDHEDERLFKLIYHKMTGKVNVAVVNAWHLPGIEYHWRHTTGTEKTEEFINPIGDFDIDFNSFGKNQNEYLRRIKSKNSKSEPAVTSDYLTGYNKQNTEAERERHVFFNGWNDPELEHGLYNDENAHVKNLPYKIKEHH